MSIQDNLRNLSKLQAMEEPKQYNMPEKYTKNLGKKKKKQSPTNALTDAIVKYIRLNGGMAARINTQGQYREGKVVDSGLGFEVREKGKWTTSGSTKGMPDVTACVLGRFLGIEVKYGRDTQSDGQFLIQQAVEASGGTYYIAKDFDSFRKWFDNWITQP